MSTYIAGLLSGLIVSVGVAACWRFSMGYSEVDKIVMLRARTKRKRTEELAEFQNSFYDFCYESPEVAGALIRNCLDTYDKAQVRP